MILAVPLAPTPSQVVIGVAAVLGGALIATTSAFVARRHGNWLHYLGTAGGLLIVVGVVGQRTANDGSPMGIWNAGLTVPLVGVGLNTVAAAGIILALLGLVVTLLFERVPDPDNPPRALVHRPFEDDDAV
ncbi:MAG TPA: hypothetical protein VIG86_05220 [Candidatus Dormibacteraeota bacterium]